jgi:hypothetical protein
MEVGGVGVKFPRAPQALSEISSSALHIFM